MTSNLFEKDEDDLNFSDLEEMAKSETTDTVADNMGTAFSLTDDSDDEDEMDNLEGSKTGIETEQNSIVPKDITKARIVALRYNNAIIAYRFKTDKGSYDMTKNTALKYGISGYKIEKVITVSVKNGFYISKKELETRTLVPDISDCEEDCKLLIDVFFNNLNA